MKYYIIFSQPRSGTHLLRAYLKELKVGNPAEIFLELAADLEKDKGRITIEEIYRRGLGKEKNSRIWGATFFYKYYAPAKQYSEINSHFPKGLETVGAGFPRPPPMDNVPI